MSISSDQLSPATKSGARVKTIANRLARLIEEGQFVQGQKLPPIRHLADRFGVSFGTVHAAIQELEGRRLVQSQQGRGTFVSAADDVIENVRPDVKRGMVYMLTHTGSPVYDEILQPIFTGLQREGFRTLPVMCNDSQPGAAMDYLLSNWEAHPPLAILASGTGQAMARMLNDRVPASVRKVRVARHSSVDPYNRWHGVSVDEYAAYKLAAQHLINTGHATVGLLTGYTGRGGGVPRHLSKFTQTRAAGMITAYREAGLEGGLRVHRSEAALHLIGQPGQDLAALDPIVAWLRSTPRIDALVAPASMYEAVEAATQRAGRALGKDLHVLFVGDRKLFAGRFDYISEQPDLICRHIVELVRDPRPSIDEVAVHITVPPRLVPAQS